MPGVPNGPETDHSDVSGPEAHGDAAGDHAHGHHHSDDHAAESGDGCGCGSSCGCESGTGEQSEAVPDGGAPAANVSPDGKLNDVEFTKPAEGISQDVGTGAPTR